MRYLLIALVIVLVYSCSENPQPQETTISREKDSVSSEIYKPGLQEVIDSASVEGSILIYDTQKEIYYSNDFEWCRKENLPASTFKITNSIIALETGVVKNDSTLFLWNGDKRALKIWEQDLIFRDAFHFSCVPCYQEIARKIGVERMNTYLEKLNYGKMLVDSTCIDIFWLEGESGISQFQQIDFLRRFYFSELPISDRTENIMKRLMVIEENEQYILSGKTGWAMRNGNNNGWFVGYLEKQEQVYFFATNVEPFETFNMDLFPKIRKEVTENALIKLNLITK